MTPQVMPALLSGVLPAMTSGVIDAVPPGGVCCSPSTPTPPEVRMTALLDTPAAVPTTTARLQRVLLADAAVTGAVGVLALALPRSTWGAAPGWVATAAGVVCLLAAADVAWASRWSGRRLRLAGAVTGELALLVAVAAGVCAVLPGVALLGRELLVLTALASAAFGVTELRLARALR